MTARRFIAGAVCPQCKRVDRTVLEQRGDELVRSCIDCGFEERMSTGAPVPGGRFDAPKKRDDGASKPVRFVNPPPKDER